MVIVGGAGTLIGPILGGIFFLLLEQQLSEVTQLWPLIFGSIFVAFVMLAPEGIWGLLTKRFRTAPPKPDGPHNQETARAAS
jgi:branched-chain amino acid transport system permease protein